MPLSFKVEFPAAFSLGPSFLEQWIAEVLCIDEGANPASAAVAGRAFASQFARVARLLLELAGIPVFDVPEAAPQTGDAGQLIVELQLPELGLIAHEAYTRVLRLAADMCQALAHRPVSSVGREALFVEIERSVIVPAQGSLVFGKSTMQVLRSAAELDIPFLHLGAGVYQLGWGSKARRLDRSIGDRDSAIAKRLVRNKAVAADVMRMTGLPAPVHELVKTAAELPAVAARLGFPLVVKPADRGRGEGVTVDIMDAQALHAAFEPARKVSPSGQVIVERQAMGVCHRLFIANGKLLYAVKRLPMSVTGDGERSIAALVEMARARELCLPPWRRSPVPVLDDVALHAMRQAGWQADSVPGAGVRVPLRRIESTQWGGIDEDVSARVHPDNLAAALGAAQAMSLENAGVDIISADIAVPWYDNGAIINEVNIGPLLGGGEISRAHLPEFLRGYVKDAGRIPIEVCSGPTGDEDGRAWQRHYVGLGMHCYLTAAAHTEDHAGRPVIMSFTRLDDRLRALTCRADVDAVVVIVQ